MNWFSNKLKKSTGKQLTAIAGYAVLLLFVFESTAQAQVWKAGRTSLMRNDFKSAKVQLLNATKTSKSNTEKAESYKYLGVAQFMSGDKKGALTSFQMAKSANPSVNLTSAEVIDESVIPLFNQASATKSNNKMAIKAPQPQTSSTGNRAPAIVKQRSKKTLLRVMSNAPSAQISLDGIAYGVAGQQIEVKPGTVILEVWAAGYKTKAIKVQLQAMTASSVTVNLDKIQPKARPQPVPKNIPLPQAKPQLTGQGRNAPGNAGKNKNDLFGDDPMSDPSLSALPQSSPQMPVATGSPAYVTPPPAPAQPIQPPQGYAQQPQGYMQQPQASGQMAPQYQMQPQYAPPAPYTVYPQYAPPMQPYATPYAQPYYAPAPYGGYMPPPNPYAYAPPTPAPYSPTPMADPYGGYLGPPPEAPGETMPLPSANPSTSSGGGMPPPAILPGETATAKKSASAKEDKCGAIRLLPFGAGQFCNGSTLKGGVFLGAELASLYFYKANADAAAKYQKTLQTYISNRSIERDKITDETELADFDSTTDTKKKEGEAAIDKARQNSQFSIVSFVGIWGAGVIDAYINVPKPKSKKSGKKTKIMYSYDLDLDTAPLGTWALSMPAVQSREGDLLNADYHLGYTPVIDRNSNSLIHALTMSLTVDL